MSEHKKWPQYVGTNGEEAKEQILKENPKLHIQVIPDGTPVT